MVEEISMISPNKFLNLKDEIKEELRIYSPLELQLHPTNLLIFSDNEDKMEELEITIKNKRISGTKISVKKSSQNFSNPHSMHMFIEQSEKDEKTEKYHIYEPINLFQQFKSEVTLTKDEMKIFLNSPLPIGNILETNLLVTDKRFSLFCNTNEKFILNGLKEMKNLSSKYVISEEYEKFDKLNNCFYLRSNLVGSIFNFYEEKKTKDERNYVCSIFYKKNIMRKNKQMEVYIPELNKGNKKTNKYIGNIKKTSLKDHYSSGEIQKLVNKPTEWNEDLKLNIAKTGKRVKMNSVKNFTLINENNIAVLYFGKTSDRTFSMDFTYPLSPMQAFAICLSSIDTKIISD